MQTTYTYDGEKTTVVPPAGDVARTEITDARGRPTTVRQYTTSSGVNGAYQDTLYSYRADGPLLSMTDPAKATWTRSYDYRGRLAEAVDPDRGKTQTKYDNADQVTTVSDGARTLAYTYDALGRKTAVYKDAVGTAPLAEWAYDAAPGGVGLLSSSTRWVDGFAYVRQVTGYDERYHVTGTSLSIPGSQPAAIAKSFTTTTKYNPDGQVASYKPYAVSGLPAETLTYSYDALGQPTTLSGYSAYVTSTTYSAFGELNRIGAGTGVATTFGYEEGTRRLVNRTVERSMSSGYAAKTGYTYDDAGNLKSVTDAPTDPTAGTVKDTQCFGYDALRHLTSAWTPSSGSCATAPSASSLGGPVPYWLSWSYDNQTGNRLNQTEYRSTGNVVSEYGHPVSGAVHKLSSVKQTIGSAVTTAAYGYDAVGSRSSVTVNGSATTYSWDEFDNLTKVRGADGKETSYVHDAAGQRLIQKDPGGTTLFLGDGTEVRVPVSGASAVGQRTYSWGGHPIAARQALSLRILASDPHNTSELSIDVVNPQTVTVRRSLPFGETRGTPPAAWPNSHGFVDGLADVSTGLVRLGVRDYDPAQGRFLSVDPVMDLSDPQQWNPYEYANANPTTFSDPSGKLYANQNPALIAAMASAGVPYSVIDKLPDPPAATRASSSNRSTTSSPAAQQPNGGNSNQGKKGPSPWQRFKEKSANASRSAWSWTTSVSEAVVNHSDDLVVDAAMMGAGMMMEAGGAALATGGAVVCLSGVGCVIGGPAVALGGAVSAAGVATQVAGVVKTAYDLGTVLNEASEIHASKAAGSTSGGAGGGGATAGLRESATRVGDNGYSPAGRAMHKKLGRPGERDSWKNWRPAKGDPAGYNQSGEAFMDELFTNPATTKTIERGRAGTPASWQDLTVYRLPSGRGASFTSDGTFVGLR